MRVKEQEKRIRRKKEQWFITVTPTQTVLVFFVVAKS